MLTTVELTVDCADAPALAEFWKLAAGYGSKRPRRGCGGRCGRSRRSCTPPPRAAFLADRQPQVYRRYDRWWTTLPSAEVRVLPG
jgi:hypothetical protein